MRATRLHSDSTRGHSWESPLPSTHNKSLAASLKATSLSLFKSHIRLLRVRKTRRHRVLASPASQSGSVETSDQPGGAQRVLGKPPGSVISERGRGTSAAGESSVPAGESYHHPSISLSLFSLFESHQDLSSADAVRGSSEVDVRNQDGGGPPLHRRAPGPGQPWRGSGGEPASLSSSSPSSSSAP